LSHQKITLLAASTNVLKKTNFTTSHIIFVVVGSKHIVEEKFKRTGIQEYELDGPLKFIWLTTLPE